MLKITQSTAHLYPSDCLCELGRRVIAIEARAIQDLVQKIDTNFATACQCLLSCQGRVIVTGMGKSGHIGKKIAATLASTGTPAFFMHPAEASHGDLGMMTAQDVVLALSNSGTTQELLTILPLIKRLGVPLITMTGDSNSLLAQAATVHLNVSVAEEACPLGLAPTSSTTAALVMGDALAIALLEARGFTAENFAFSHPGGTLGKRLFLRVEDIMHTGKEIPLVTENTLLTEALVEISKKRFGMTAIINSANQLLGVFTDGDLRRTLDKRLDIHTTLINKVMTTHCKVIPPNMLAAEALKVMEDNKITGLIVVNAERIPIGILHMHDLLKAGII